MQVTVTGFGNCNWSMNRKIKEEAKKDALLMIAFFIFILLSRESEGGAA